MSRPMKPAKTLRSRTPAREAPDKDEEDLALERDPEFWPMIEQRRREPSIPLEEVKKRLFQAKKEGDT